VVALVLGKLIVGATCALLATTVLVHDGRPYAPRPYTAWLAQFAVPPPPGYVDFGIGSCADRADLGCMEWTHPVATVRIVRLDRLDRFTFAHEMGHVFDDYVLNPIGWRDRFAALEGFAWRTPTSEEYFADSYALCALHRRLAHAVTTDYGFHVTPALHLQICGLIRSAYEQWLTTPPASPLGQALLPEPQP
jgi:hypothetical protein